jgi:hypothetical protein
VYGEEVGGSGLGEFHRPHRVPSQVAAPFTAIVVDFQVSGMFPADLEHISLP